MRKHIAIHIVCAGLLGSGLVLSRSALAAWLTTGVPVCTEINDQLFQCAVPDGAGGLIVAWQDPRDSACKGIYVQRISSAGVPLWAVDGVLISESCAAMPGIFADGLGGAIVVFAAVVQVGEVRAQRISAAGLPQWSSGGVVVGSHPAGTTPPAVVADGVGGFIIAWGNGGDVYAQRLSPTGAALWAPAGVPLCTMWGSQIHVRLVSDHAGGAIVTWDDNRIPNHTQIYAQRVLANGTPAWTLDGVPVSLITDSNGPWKKYFVTMEEDGTGGAIIAWMDLRAGNNAHRIYAQRLLADGNPQWATNGVPVCSTTGSQSFQRMVSDGEGGVVIAFFDSRGFTNSDTPGVYAQRIGADGTPLWAPGGIAICTIVTSKSDLVACPDGAGGAIVAWTNIASPSNDHYILAQSISAAGGSRWAPQGTLLSPGPVRYTDSTDDNRTVAVTNDGAGGAMIVWQEIDPSEYEFLVWWGTDLYAQHVQANGQIGGYVAGVPEAMGGVLQVFPNPFNPRTTIKYDLPEAGPVRLSVFDLAGRLVRTLVDDSMPPGSHEAAWDGRDSAGREVGSGGYLARLSFGGRVETVRMGLVR